MPEPTIDPLTGEIIESEEPRNKNKNKLKDEDYNKLFSLLQEFEEN